MDFTIEELSMNAWPALHTLLYDGWIVRMSDGYSNRANSVNPIYPSKIGLEEKIAFCDELFSGCNLPATYKLAECEEHRIIDEELERRGYRIINKTSIQTREISPAPKGGGGGIVVSDDFSESWKNSVIEFNKIEEKYRSVFKKITGTITGEKIVVHKEIDNTIAGCGYGAISRGYVGVFDIVVKENLRGKGYGGEIVDSILGEAAKRGVKKSYLQVMITNSAALRLYEKLGYREQYKYWYRKKIM